ncbi:baseplate wedge tail fiber connector [Salmonella phage 19]|nr:baseplate wedge tail fiber connector [Salmonella phage 19]
MSMKSRSGSQRSNSSFTDFDTASSTGPNILGSFQYDVG